MKTKFLKQISRRYTWQHDGQTILLVDRKMNKLLVKNDTFHFMLDWVTENLGLWAGMNYAIRKRKRLNKLKYLNR